MYSQLKKRKKTTFNNYKAVRTNIHLNNSSFEIVSQHALQHNLLYNWEHQWLEQLNELSQQSIKSNPLSNKQSKLLMKWWEKN